MCDRSKGGGIGSDDVIHMVTVTYSPIKGKTSDVGGIFSATNMRNTVIERRVVIPIVTFSPESLGI